MHLLQIVRILGGTYYHRAKTIGAKMRDLILYHDTTWASAVRIKNYGVKLSFKKIKMREVGHIFTIWM